MRFAALSPRADVNFFQDKLAPVARFFGEAVYKYLSHWIYAETLNVITRDGCDGNRVIPAQRGGQVTHRVLD